MKLIACIWQTILSLLKKKALNKLSHTQKQDTVGQIEEARKRIMETMPEAILFTDSKLVLCAYVLQQFDFPEGTIDYESEASVDSACVAILNIIGIDEAFNQMFPDQDKPWLMEPKNRLLHYLLDFDYLPNSQLAKLKGQVQHDLDSINATIATYELFPFIANGTTPRNHPERTRRDFYLRCIEEKKLIEKHLATGIKERALHNARSNEGVSGMLSLWVNGYKDRPYRLPLPKSNQYFDFEAIDTVTHRILKLPIRIGKDLKKYYRQDKRHFYEELHKHIPVAVQLDTLMSGINFNPFVSASRKNIFKEIVSLYNDQKWFGLYALSLTQVEGLFADMGTLCEPKSYDAKGALPDKVENIRRFNPSAEYRLDYFQYHLPNLRNSFLHYGDNKEEQIDVLCNDIVYDLIEVGSLFLSLEIDAVKLLHLIRKRSDVDFMSISGLALYFRYLTSIRKNGSYHYLKSEIEDLERIFLPDIVFNVVFDLEELTQGILDKIVPVIKVRSAAEGYEVDLPTITRKQIFVDTSSIVKAIGYEFDFQYKSEITQLLDTRYFLQQYKNCLDLNAIDQDTLKRIAALQTQYHAILETLELLDSRLQQRALGLSR